MPVNQREIGSPRKPWSTWATAFSLANLFLLEAWRVIQPDSIESYLTAPTHSRLLPAAMILVILLLTGALVAVLRFVKPMPRIWRVFLPMGTLFSAVIFLNALRRMLQGSIHLLDTNIVTGWIGDKGLFILLATAGILALGLLFRFQTRVETPLRQGLLILSPLPLLLFVHTFIRFGAVIDASARPWSASPGSHAPIILYIFDEMDQGWTFDQRPKRLILPNIDAFQKISTWASAAYPPASETIRSIPALLIGQRLEAVRLGPNQDLLVKIENAPWKRWSETNDLPKAAGALGFRTRIINHVHPFPKAYLANRPGLEVRHRDYYPYWANWRERFQSFPRACLSLLVCIPEGIPGYKTMFERPSPEVDHIRDLVHWVEETSLSTVMNHEADLLIVHWPIPHHPNLIHPSGMLPSLPGRTDHLDNLLLVDKAIGDLRNTLMAERLWKDATVIITSDHWQRTMCNYGIPRRHPNDHRIPIMIKLPNQTSEFEIQEPVNNLLINRLILGLLSGVQYQPSEVSGIGKAFPPQGLYDPLVD